MVALKIFPDFSLTAGKYAVMGINFPLSNSQFPTKQFTKKVCFAETQSRWNTVVARRTSNF